MSQQGRNEAKRLRRLKRKGGSENFTSSNLVDPNRIAVFGGGTLAFLAIALGLNSLPPDGQSTLNQEMPIEPIDKSQSPTPSSSPTAIATPDFFSDTVSGVSGAFKISITASPSASPSASLSATPSPSPSASQSPGIQQGSYLAEGRYGAGYYSTAYDVALSSPMFQAGSGSFYGASGYDEAIDSPHGYYSQGGWKGSGFYERGYFDYSALFAGTWDGSGITYPYGSGACYGISGFSSAEYEPQGSYFLSGYFGSGHYTQVFFDYSQGDHSQGVAVGTGSYYGVSGLSSVQNTPRGYLSGTGNYGSGYYEAGYLNFSGNTGSTVYWNGQSVGTGAYYGVSGYSDPIYGVRGSYYASGIAGSGYYSSLFTGGYYQVTNFNSWNQVFLNVGVGTYYGISGTSAPIAAPTGSYYATGFNGAGYYSTGYYDCGYGYVTGASEYRYYFGNIGRQTYYGLSRTSTPVAGPEGIFRRDGFQGSGYYEPTDQYESEYRFGTGSYYGVSGYAAPLAPPIIPWYSTGWTGPGYYSTGTVTGTYYWQRNGTGTFYGTSGNGIPLAPPV